MADRLRRLQAGNHPGDPGVKPVAGEFADLNGLFAADGHLASLTEQLRRGDTGRVREAIRAPIENTRVGEDEPLTLDVKPQGLLGAQTTIAHSGCRGTGPIMERTIQSSTGRQCKVIAAGSR